MTSPSRAQPGRLSTAIMWLLVVAALLATVLPSFFDGGESAEAVPVEDLYGSWATDDQRYADRVLRIRPGEITLGVGGGQVATYAIREIEADTESGANEYSIVYRAVGGDLVLRVFLADNGTMRLNNPPEVVWRRIPEGAR